MFSSWLQVKEEKPKEEIPEEEPLPENMGNVGFWDISHSL